MLGNVVTDYKNFLIQKIGSIFTPQTADPALDSSTPALWYRGDLSKLRFQDGNGVLHSVAMEDNGATVQAQTTNATPLNVTLRTPAKSSASAVRVLISAVKSDGTVAASWMAAAAFRCDSTGAIAIIDDIATLLNVADAGFAPSIDLKSDGSGNIVAALTGISSTTINWVVKYEVAN